MVGGTKKRVTAQCSSPQIIQERCLDGLPREEEHPAFDGKTPAARRPFFLPVNPAHGGNEKGLNS